MSLHAESPTALGGGLGPGLFPERVAPTSVRPGLEAHVQVIGVPCGLGASLRGSELGPAALRIAGLHEALGGGLTDGGDLFVPTWRDVDPGLRAARYAGPISEVCRALYLAVDETLANRRVPLVLGGDHALAAGSVASVADAVAASGGRLGVLWIDAHGDSNTPMTSPTGNLHGMPLASLLGVPGSPFSHLRRRAPVLRAGDVALIGTRDLDAGESALFQRIGLDPFEPDGNGDFDRAAALTRLSDCTHLYVSFDVDSLDPAAAPGVGTPVARGLSIAAVEGLFAALHADGRLCGAEIMELNPLMDERNRTARVALSLMRTLMRGPCASPS